MPRPKLFWQVLNKLERAYIVFYETSPMSTGGGWNMPDDVVCCGVCGEPRGSFSCGCDKEYERLINKAKRLMKRVKERNNESQHTSQSITPPSKADTR
jgi:hypothetical protein